MCRLCLNYWWLCCTMGISLWPCHHKNALLWVFLAHRLSSLFFWNTVKTVRPSKKPTLLHSFSHANIQSFRISVSSRGVQHQLSSYRETVIRQATASAAHRDDAPTCGICHKTKFADGCGNLCSYCQTKFCARCGGRVSLRSNTVRCGGSSHLYVVMWMCYCYF